MFFEQNPIITAQNYRQQDLNFRPNQIGPTYKTWHPSDNYHKPLLPNSPKVDYYADVHKPIYDFSKPWERKF